MSAGGVGDGLRGDDGTPTGSALLGMLLALAIIVGSVCAAFIIPEVMADVVYDFQTRNVPDGAHDEVLRAEQRRADAEAMTELDARATGAEAGDDRADAGLEESPAGDNFMMALTYLVSPMPVLLIVGIWLHRRPKRRTVKGFWIGALSGLISLGLVLGGVWHVVTFGTFG